MDLVSAQTGEVYIKGQVADKDQDKSQLNEKGQNKSDIVNIEDKKSAPKRDDMAI